ncbi:hypothetical protein GCM10027418_28040 [Mariniluteicoccus endophyticus]
MLVLASASGAPGVTTLALALTLGWRRDALLVDADRQPGQAIQAGWLGGASVGGRGLSGLARVHRERRSMTDELLHHCVPLSEGVPRRLFLPGFNHPSAPGLFQPLWPDLVAALERVQETGLDVVVDAGRVSEGLPAPLVAAARTTLLVTRTDLRSLAAVRLQIPQMLQRQSQSRPSARIGLVLVGEGQPYTGREIEAQFGVPVLGVVADDATSARHHSHGEPRPARFESRAYARSVRALASSLGAAEEVGVR